MNVIMTKSHIQSQIAYNAKRINALEIQSQYLRSCMKLYWRASNPLVKTQDSCVAFHCLNEVKDRLRKIKKELDVLRATQYAMKHASLF
jgi:hypothetical protein